MGHEGGPAQLSGGGGISGLLRGPGIAAPSPLQTIDVKPHYLFLEHEDLNAAK